MKMMNGGAATLLPATRGLKKVMCRGQVAQMCKWHGWIWPLDMIAHPAARQRGGRVYVSVEDICCHRPLVAGEYVIFFLYLDEQGLGAEQCMLIDQCTNFVQSDSVGCNRVDLLVLRDDDAESDSDSKDGSLGESSWDDLESVDETPVAPKQHTLNLSLLLGIEEPAPVPKKIQFLADTDASTDASDDEDSSDSDTSGSEHRMAVMKFQPPPGLPPPFGPPPGLPVPPGLEGFCGKRN